MNRTHPEEERFAMSAAESPSPGSEPPDNGDYPQALPEYRPRSAANEDYQPTRIAMTSAQEYRPRSAANEDVDGDDGGVGCCGIIMIAISWVFIILTFPLSLCATLKTVAEYERIVIFRLGRIQKGVRGPGLFFTYPCTDTIHLVDLRTVTFDVPPQQILTKDSVTVAVDAVCYYKIIDPLLSVTSVEDYRASTQLLASSQLRNALGTRTLGEILSMREEISDELEQLLDVATDPWGIKVERLELKDVRLPQDLQRAMAAEAEASREAKAKVISAEGEQRASKALKEAADVLAGDGSAIQLRYLQTLTGIASQKNHTIVLPFPRDFLMSYMNKK